MLYMGKSLFSSAVSTAAICNMSFKQVYTGWLDVHAIKVQLQGSKIGSGDKKKGNWDNVVLKI